MSKRTILEKLTWLGAMNNEKKYSSVLRTFSENPKLLRFGDVRKLAEGNLEISVYNKRTKNLIGVTVPARYFHEVKGASDLLDEAEEICGLSGRYAKRLDEKIEKENIQKKEKEKTERGIKINRIMKKGLIGLMTGVALTGAAWFGANHYTSPEYKRACELDEKAVYVIPQPGKEKSYNINGEEIRLARVAANSFEIEESPNKRLRISVNNKFGFVSESWNACLGGPFWRC